MEIIDPPYPVGDGKSLRLSIRTAAWGSVYINSVFKGVIAPLLLIVFVDYRCKIHELFFYHFFEFETAFVDTGNQANP